MTWEEEARKLLERDALLAAAKRIAFEPIGAADASDSEVLAGVVGIAVATIAACSEGGEDVPEG